MPSSRMISARTLRMPCIYLPCGATWSFDLSVSSGNAKPQLITPVVVKEKTYAAKLLKLKLIFLNASFADTQPSKFKLQLLEYEVLNQKNDVGDIEPQ